MAPPQSGRGISDATDSSMPSISVSNAYLFGDVKFGGGQSRGWGPFWWETGWNDASRWWTARVSSFGAWSGLGCELAVCMATGLGGACLDMQGPWGLFAVDCVFLCRLTGGAAGVSRCIVVRVLE